MKRTMLPNIETREKLQAHLIKTGFLQQCKEIVEYTAKKQNNNTWYMIVTYKTNDGYIKHNSTTVKI